MRLARLFAVAAFAVASLSAFAPAQADHCEEPCDCVVAPCHADEWPPFLLGKVGCLTGTGPCS